MNDARRISEEAAGWLLDMRDEPDLRTRERFMAWLRRSPLHVAEYLAIARLDGDMRAVVGADNATFAELRGLASSEPSVVPLFDDRRPATTPPVARPRRRRPLAIAAAIATLATLGTATLGLPSAPDIPAIRYTADGRVREVILDDDTIVMLEPGSVADIRFDSRQRRVDLVAGRASFDVGKDATRPFSVTVGNQRIRDIGTVFEVGHDAEGAHVGVVSGEVAVAPANQNWTARARERLGVARSNLPVVRLVAGETARIGDDGEVISRGRVDMRESTAWLPADIRFQDESVATVARRFNAYTATPLHVDDPALAAKRISGVFHAHDPEAFVGYLASLPGVHVTRGEGRIRFTSTRPL